MASLANHAEAMQPSVHSVETATSQLSELIEAALSGDEVVIAKDGKPAVRLATAAIRFPSRDTERQGQRIA